MKFGMFAKIGKEAVSKPNKKIHRLQPIWRSEDIREG